MAAPPQSLDQLVATVTSLHGADVDGCDYHGLRKLSQQSLTLQAWLAAFDGRVANAASKMTIGGQPVDASNVVGGSGRRSKREAEAAVERGRACDAVPEVGAALAGGEVSADHVDALAKATGGLSDAARERFAEHGEELATEARFETPEQFGRRCRELANQVTEQHEAVERHERLRRQRKVSRWTDPDGTCNTKLSLDPLTDAAVWAVIQQSIDQARAACQVGDDRTFEQLRADAMVDVLTRPPNADEGTQGWIPEVSVLIDLDSLLGSAAAAGLQVSETADGQPLPIDVVRRMCCDAKVLPIVLNGDGIPVDVGRAQRLATPAQRAALRAMYATCGHSQCTVAFDRCRIHHLAFWQQLGPTDLANLIPLCERHHHLVHEGGWSLTMTADRVATWRAPDGSIVFRGDSRNRRQASAATAVTGNQHLTTVVASGDRHRAADTTSDRYGLPGGNEQASRMADEVARRRRDAAAATANTTAASRRRNTVSEPVPLFGIDGPVQRRGPPQAS